MSGGADYDSRLLETWLRYANHPEQGVKDFYKLYKENPAGFESFQNEVLPVINQIRLSHAAGKKFEDQSYASWIDVTPDGDPVYAPVSWEDVARGEVIKKFPNRFATSNEIHLRRRREPLHSGNLGAGIGEWAGPVANKFFDAQQRFGVKGGIAGNALAYGGIGGLTGFGTAALGNFLAGKEKINPWLAAGLMATGGALYGGVYSHRVSSQAKKPPEVASLSSINNPVNFLKKDTQTDNQKTKTASWSKSYFDEAVQKVMEANAPYRARASAIRDLYAAEEKQRRELKAMLGTIGAGGVAAAALNSFFGKGGLPGMVATTAGTLMAGIVGGRTFGKP